MIAAYSETFLQQRISKYESLQVFIPLSRVLWMLSHPSPFTELLPKVSERLVNATLLVPSAESRTLQRVGIVASTEVANDEVPPGIARFIKYISRPWNGLLDHFNHQITANLDDTPDWSDRCIHILTRPEDPEQLLSLKFDWQRTFKEGQPLTHNSLNKVLENAEKDSMKYFEELAEGNRFDEDLIPKAT